MIFMWLPIGMAI